MSSMASQITSASIVCSTVCSGAGQRKHQSSAWLAFVRGIQRWPMNSPHKESVTPDSKAIWGPMGPTWVLSAPDGPHVGPMNLAIRDAVNVSIWWRHYDYFPGGIWHSANTRGGDLPPSPSSQLLRRCPTGGVQRVPPVPGTPEGPDGRSLQGLVWFRWLPQERSPGGHRSSPAWPWGGTVIQNMNRHVGRRGTAVIRPRWYTDMIKRQDDIIWANFAHYKSFGRRSCRRLRRPRALLTPPFIRRPKSAVFIWKLSRRSLKASS